MHASEQSIQTIWTRFITRCWVHHNTPLSSGSFSVALTVVYPLAPCWSGALLEFWLWMKSSSCWIISVITWKDSGVSFFFCYTGQLWSNESTAYGDRVASWAGKYLPCLFIQQKQTLSNAYFPNTCIWHISSLPICLMGFADSSSALCLSHTFCNKFWQTYSLSNHNKNN